MARITVEDCLNRIDNRFAIIHLAAKRVRQLRKGAEPTIVCKNKDIVTALREIAAGTVEPAGKNEFRGIAANSDGVVTADFQSEDKTEGQ
jgi:DNA-directed RNA polymerase subunit omega